jgi:hypothetical protein
MYLTHAASIDMTASVPAGTSSINLHIEIRVRISPAPDTPPRLTLVLMNLGQ